MPNGTTPEPKEGQNAGGQAGDDDNPDINAIVNSAVTAQLKRALSPKALAAALAPIVSEIVKPLQDELATLKQAPAPAPGPAPAPDKPNPELTAVKQQLQEMKDQLAKERDRAAAAEAKQRDDSTFAKLKDCLSAAKVRPEMVEVLAKVLFHADKRVEFDEQGNPLLRVRVSPGKGLPEEDQVLTLEEGVKTYVKTKEAEPFMPPPGGAGGGTNQQQRRAAPSPSRGQASTQESPPQTDEERAQRALEQMNKLGVSL